MPNQGVCVCVCACMSVGVGTFMHICACLFYVCLLAWLCICVSRRGCSAWCWTRTQTWQWKWSICYCWSKCEGCLCLWWFPCATIRNIQYRNFLFSRSKQMRLEYRQNCPKLTDTIRVYLSLCFTENSAIQVNLALAVIRSIYFIQLVFGLCTI